ncbi:twin-arginine translocation signal domain-containing protein, partial [Mesorhizobium sp. M5C.F.Ca.IN.020.14.1.1]
MLTKRKSGQANRTRLHTLMGTVASAPIDRRTFLRRSGLVAGGMAVVGSFQLGTVQKAAAIS